MRTQVLGLVVSTWYIASIHTHATSTLLNHSLHMRKTRLLEINGYSLGLI